MLNHMRTTLDLPDGLIEEARATLDFKSKTDTVTYALREVIRRSRVQNLKALMKTVSFDLDPIEMRARDRQRV